MNDIKFSITPRELLDEVGVNYKKKEDWLAIRKCIFCDGGQHDDLYTFGVHVREGTFNCLRTSCNEKGSFWELLKHYGYDPAKYIVENSKKPKPNKKSGFVYGRKK